MCDPEWIYGIPISIDSLCEYARDKAPECIYRDGTDDGTTFSLVIAKLRRHFRRKLLPSIGIDVFAEELNTQLVLVLHRDYPGESKYTLEDEDWLRKELGIREKGKWYRYYGFFFYEDLEEYKKSIPGPIPSRDTCKPLDGVSNKPSSDITPSQFSHSDASASVWGAMGLAWA